jgi:hypothetical protein
VNTAVAVEFKYLKYFDKIIFIKIIIKIKLKIKKLFSIIQKNT